MAEQTPSGFKDLLNAMMSRRWYITAMVLGGFMLIIAGIFVAISLQTPMAAAWKELLMLLLGAFIGSYGKIIDYWFSDTDKDKMLVQKMDEEDGVSLSNTVDMPVTNQPFAPLIPDAFVQGAAAARELAKVENIQDFEIEKTQIANKHELDKLEIEHHAHRYCKHVWGDSDHDGHDECQVCGLLKENIE
jgi:hypothetical protein